MFQKKQRQQYHGAPEDFDTQHIHSLIVALQTHDAVGNHPQGKRLHQLASIAFQRAAAPLFLLNPAIPMMFMGEELATNSPFLFFTDFHDKDIQRNVDMGRKREFPDVNANEFISPGDERAFYDSRLQALDESNAMYRWYRALLGFRQLGVKSGWLKASALSIDTCINENTFLLNFETGQSNAFVAVKLSSRDAQQLAERTASVQLTSADGQGLLVSLNSNSVDITEDIEQPKVAAVDQVSLSENHAVLGFGRAKLQ